jgi:hypothetical protein
MGRNAIVRILRALADALEPEREQPRRKLVIEPAPAGTVVPPPYMHVTPGDRLDAVLAGHHLRAALRRYSPREENYYA